MGKLDAFLIYHGGRFYFDELELPIGIVWIDGLILDFQYRNVHRSIDSGCRSRYFRLYLYSSSRLRHADADNLDVCCRLLFKCVRLLDLENHVQTLHCSAEDRVLVIQPRGLLRRNEELTAIGVGTRIGHRECVGLIVAQTGELVGEFSAPDGFTSSAVALGVTSLDHELGDHTVEDRVIVVALASMSDEVLHGPGSS